MPLESAERRSRRATGRKLGLIEDRIAEAQSINPRLEVGETNTKLQGQLLGRFPGVLPEELVRTVMNIVDAVLVCFLIVGMRLPVSRSAYSLP